MGVDVNVQLKDGVLDATLLDANVLVSNSQNRPQLRANGTTKDNNDSSPKSSNFSIHMPHVALTSTVGAAIFSYFYLAGKETAHPPPEDLPAPNIKNPCYLHYFLIPPLLIIAALHVGARLPKNFRKISNAFFAVPMWYVIWVSLRCGTRSSAIGFAVGTANAYHFLQILDLLFLSDPAEEFSRVPVRLENKSIVVEKETRCEEQPYPRNASSCSRLSWVFDLTVSMRLLGWKATVPKTPNFHHESAKNPRMYISRTQFLSKQLLALFIMGLLADFLTWNIRFNDTAFYMPNNFRNSPEYKSAGVSGGSTVFSSNYEPVSVRPAGIFRSPRFPAGYDPALTPYPKFIPPLPHPSPTSPILYHALYAASVFTFRFICQAAAIYIAIRGVFTVTSIFLVTLGLVFHPQSYTDTELSDPSSSARWFHPLYYPPMNGSFKSSYWGGKGILGFWSRGWHSLFRRVYARPGVVISEKILGINPRASAIAKALIITTAFALSAFLHYVGVLTHVYKYTDSNGNVLPLPLEGFQSITRGGWGTVSFFVAQIIGIGVERTVVWLLGDERKKYPKWIPYLWTLAFFMYTGGWFFDDYRWAGLWRTEATPLSLWGAYAGNQGEYGGWWRWGRRIGKDGEQWGWWEWSASDVLWGWGIIL